MAAAAYFDKTMAISDLRQLLGQLHGEQDMKRTKMSAWVYKVDGGGEAMVEPVGRNTYRVRLYRGVCPC
jgi:hypothetical protein